jgi:paraquat-inducible protein A
MTSSAHHGSGFRNRISIFLTVLSFFFLVPGIYLSMLSVSTSGSINAGLPHVESNFIGMKSQSGTDQKHINIKIFDTTRSILKTVRDLWQRDYFFVSSMIFLFSVLVPFVKGFSLLLVYFGKSLPTRKKLFNFIKSIGKWSMCDVYIVAIYLCYLSTGATQTKSEKSISMMGYPIDVQVMAGMHAQLHIGFWCFLTYCLLSLTALQLYKFE